MPRGLSLPGICHTEVATFWTQPVVPGSGFGKDSKGTDGCPAGLSAAAPPAAPLRDCHLRISTIYPASFPLLRSAWLGLPRLGLPARSTAWE